MDVKQEVGVAGFLDPEIKMEDEEDSEDLKGKVGEEDAVLLKTSGRSRGDVGHKVKQEPKGETSKNWDAQLQEFLKTLQTPDSIEETSQKPRTKQCSDPKMDPAYSQAIIDINTCCKELWVSPQQSHHIGDVEQDSSTHLNTRLLGKEKERTLTRNPAKAELQRQRFRMLSYEEARSPRDLCWQLQESCRQWLEPERHTKEQVLELVTLEQFLAILPLDMQSWVKESGPETCAQAVTLAEEFLRRQPEGKIIKLQVAKFSEEPSAKSPKAMKALLLGKGKLHILTKKERECNGNENMSKGDRYLSENQERNPLMDSIEQTEQPTLYMKRDRESDFVYQEEKEAIENQHKAEGRNGESKTTRLDQLIQSQGVSEGISLPATQEDKNGAKYDKSGGKCHFIVQQNPEGLEEEPYRCWHCGESFGSSVKLVTHERTHVGEKLYKCSCCGESERTHTGQKPHKCSHCGNTFGCTPQERIPGEEKSYTCSECGTSFSQRSDLLQHQRIHTVEPKKDQEDNGESVEKPREIKIKAEEESVERPREIKREREEEDPQAEEPSKKQRLMMETRSVRTESLKPEARPQEPCRAPSDCPSFSVAKNLQVTAAKQEEYASALIYLLGADFINRHGESGRFVYSLRRKRVAARQTWMPGWVHYKCQKLILFHCAESRKKPKRKLERFHLGNISKRLAIHQRECAPIELCPCLTDLQQIHVHRIVHDWAHQYEYVAQPGNSQPGRSRQPQGQETEG